MERRDLLKLSVSGAAGIVLGTSALETNAQEERPPRANRPRGERRPMTKYPSAHFYKDGVFQPEVAKAAYFEMFENFRYTLTTSLRDNADFWVAEFGLGDFAQVGMAGIFWVNDKEHGYFGHEIYLLPGQMIPEHYHLPGEGLPAKHEAWQVRHGSIFNFGKGGEQTPEVLDMLPKSQLDAKAITCFQYQELKVGGFAKLAALGEPHFMMAGPEGAIVTEYASYHSMEGLGFTNKKAAL